MQKKRNMFFVIAAIAACNLDFGDILAEYCEDNPSRAACIECEPEGGTSEYAICLQNSELAGLLGMNGEIASEESTEGGSGITATKTEPLDPFGYFHAEGVHDGTDSAYSMDLDVVDIDCQLITDVESGTEHFRITATDAQLEADICVSLTEGKPFFIPGQTYWQELEKGENLPIMSAVGAIVATVDMTMLIPQEIAPRAQALRSFKINSVVKESAIGWFRANDLCAQDAETTCVGTTWAYFACKPELKFRFSEDPHPCE
ncbi:MAG: hypothetical protein Q7S48_04690 [bacterium]|nr:hypothetical protein [bacterium]